MNPNLVFIACALSFLVGLIIGALLRPKKVTVVDYESVSLNPEQRAEFDKAFAKSDEAFAQMDKAFNSMRKP